MSRSTATPVSATSNLWVALLCGVLSLLPGCATSEPGTDRAAAAPAPTPSREATPDAVPAPPDPDSAPDETTDTATREDPRRGHAAPVVEVFPFVRIDRDRRRVLIDGYVPIDCHHPETPDVYLELIACVEGTRDHESLVATRARPSHVHAALLLLGAEPGRPGTVRWTGRRAEAVPPRGPQVEVTIRTGAGAASVDHPAASWVRVADAAEAGVEREAGWVFAGSDLPPESSGASGVAAGYSADRSGNLVGLATFGDAVVGYRTVRSPDSGVHEPAWLADGDRVPPLGTPVTLILTPKQ